MSLWSKWMARGRSSAPDGASGVPSTSENNADSAQAWFEKAEALTEVGRHEEAVTSYDHALALDPRMAMALRGKARILDQLGKSTEALAVIEQSLRVDPGLALAWRAKGAILRGLGQDAEGLVCYERGLAIDPRDPFLWCNKGNVLLALGRLAEAQASYQRALSIDPAFTDAINGLRRAKKAELQIKNFRRDPPEGRRMAVTASDCENLKRWLSALGFELRREVSGSSTLVGDNSYEHFDHYKTSLWMGSSRLGNWGTTGDHDVWFTFEPDAGAEQVGPQYDAWNRLAELLASKAEQVPPPGEQLLSAVSPMKGALHGARVLGELKWSQAPPTFFLNKLAAPAKRLTVFSYSSPDAEPEETFGNLLTGGSRRAEVSKSELENIISSDAVVTSRLELHGYRLTDHFKDERRGSRSCSIVHGDLHVGHMVSYESNLSITLYRNSAEYSSILEVLRS